jgi:hypothetical protein
MLAELTISAWIVIALRLLLPLTIFRWRIFGAITALIIDALDVVLVDTLVLLFNEPQVGFGDHYQFIDKWLDMYYLSIEAIVSLRFASKLARNTSIALYTYRLLGLVLFEITGARKLFLFFPNLFENFFLYYVIVERFFPKLVPITKKQLALVLAVLLIPKLGQEWLLHATQAHPWGWIRETFLPFIIRR